MGKIRNIVIAFLLIFISKNIIFNLLSEDKEIVIQGKISPYYNYRIISHYKAYSSLPICYSVGSGWLFGNGSFWVKKSKRIGYEPNVHNGKHEITIPLNYQGVNMCDFQLEEIFLEVPFDNDILLFETMFGSVEYGYPSNSSNYKRNSRLYPIFKSHNENNYTIDFYGYSDYIKYTNKMIDEENKITKRSKKLKSSRKIGTLLHKLILSPYILKYKKFPTENQMKDFWSKDNKLLFLDKKRIETLAKLKESINYDKSGYPVDEWGNHFKYKVIPAKMTSTSDWAIIFSLGEDGIESKDDIASQIRQTLPSPDYHKDNKMKNKIKATRRSINVLMELLNGYQYKYKKIATVEESKELFKKDNKFNIHVLTSSNSTEKDLIYINNQPVDSWNHPFIYEPNRDYPMIYSLGEDGVKSFDDIKRKMFKLF